MSSVKIISRSGLVWNLVLFCLLQFLFLHVVSEVHLGRSALSLASFKKYTLSMLPLLVLSVALMYSIFQAKKISLLLFILHSLAIVILASRVFIAGLDKVVLILLFAFIVMSYIMFIMWKMELEEASFRPGYTKKSLFRFLEYRIPVELRAGEHTVSGMLSNWDDNSFFMFAQDPLPVKLGRLVDVNIQLNEHLFTTKAKIVSVAPGGFGLRVMEESSLASRDWKSFYDIIKSRGYINRFA